MQIATDHLSPDFRSDGRQTLLLSPDEPWGKLTRLGTGVVARVVCIPGVVSLWARPDYFDLEVKSEDVWHRVLPAVVQIIREEARDPKAVVKLHPQGGTMAGYWHADLLKELFG